MSTELKSPEVYQSPPLDITSSWDMSSVKHKTILITGGCSGFGKGFFVELAKLGATVVIGDLSDGTKLVEQTKTKTGNLNLHYIPLDVTDYKSQCDFFLEGKRLSPKNAIDGVIANAGITEKTEFIEPLSYVEGVPPPPPNLKTLDVNLTGVMYTTYLAYHYFRNHPKLSEFAYPTATDDRSLLLIGSCSSFVSLPPVSLYSTSKHGILGLFRALRFTAKAPKIRVNMLAPYFVETGILPAAGRVLLAGAKLAELDDVVNTGVRIMGDSSVAGRVMAIWPHVENDEGQPGGVIDYEVDDFKDVELFTRNVVKGMNAQIRAAGWVGWFKDILLLIWAMFIGKVPMQ